VENTSTSSSISTADIKSERRLSRFKRLSGRKVSPSRKSNVKPNLAAA
jgi:hypothetical protein